MASDTFLRRLEERRAAQQQELAALEPQISNTQSGTHQSENSQPSNTNIPEQFQQDIVTGMEETSSISPEQKVLDDFISRLRIVECYNNWAQKGMVNPPATRTDSIKVRCPNPAHPDKHPSAWLNTEKNVYFCASCSQGGDIWDIAAWYFGFSVPDYKKDAETFRLLREKIGEYFGYVLVKGVSGKPELVQIDQSQVENTPETQPEAPKEYPQTQPDNVTYTASGSELAEKEFEKQLLAHRKFPGIDWRAIIPRDTFMYAYLDAVSSDDSPEEYHFWNSLIAVGMGCGAMRTLEDAPEITGNLYVCLTGPSGVGKSKSNRHLVNLLLQAVPYKPDDQPPFGASYIKGTQSGEFIIRAFQHPLIDASGKPTGKYWPNIKGCIHFDELADLIGKSSRQGSSLKTTLMELYDAPVHLRSSSLAHGVVDAERPFGSVVTTTQFRSIRNLITNSDDGAGFANRWVFATGIPKQQFAINRLKADLTSAISKLSAISISCRTHTLVTWSPEAESIWTSFFNTVFGPMRQANEDSSIVQRIDLLLKKLFLLFAVNEKATVLSGDVVTRVLTLYHHIFETYKLIEGEIAATVEGDEVTLLLRTIQRMQTETGVSARELHRSLSRRVTSVAKLRKMLDNLEALGMIDEYKLPPGPKGGRPVCRYKLAPGVQVAV